MSSTKNKLKAGSLLAGTIASAAAVGAQQASANFITDWLYNKSEGDSNKGKSSIFSGLEKVYDAGKAALGLYTLKVITQSNSYTEGLTNALAAGFKNYAVPVLKVTSEQILNLAGQYPFLAAVTAITTINYIYQNYFTGGVAKSEYDRGKDEGKKEILDRLEKEDKEENIINKAKKRNKK